MAKPGADEIITQKHRRAFSQRGGPFPTNQIRYAGPNEQYMSFDAADNPVRGGEDPIWMHDPQRRGAYRLVGRSVSRPTFRPFLSRSGSDTRACRGSITT